LRRAYGSYDMLFEVYHLQETQKSSYNTGS